MAASPLVSSVATLLLLLLPTLFDAVPPRSCYVIVVCSGVRYYVLVYDPKMALSSS